MIERRAQHRMIHLRQAHICNGHSACFYLTKLRAVLVIESRTQSYGTQWRYFDGMSDVQAARLSAGGEKPGVSWIPRLPGFLGLRGCLGG